MPDSDTPARWPRYARVPPFLPVPVRARAGGWTPARQARFVGLLAETGCVAEAARRVGVSRVAAYQLRARAGAESFAHAWDTVISLRADATGRCVALPKRNFTVSEVAELAFDGALVVRMRRGRFVSARREPCARSLIRHVNRLDAAAARYGWDWCDSLPEEAPR
jgi:hypothetical protein